MSLNKSLSDTNLLNDTESARKRQLTIRLSQSQFETVKEIEEDLGVSKAKAVRIIIDRIKTSLETNENSKR